MLPPLARRKTNQAHLRSEVRLFSNSVDLTFNQLLAKYGYIEDESMTKKERVRAWHIKKPRGNDSDDSDE
jgi:hypothetical protein